LQGREDSKMAQFLIDETGMRLSYYQLTGTDLTLPGVVFLGGFRSDMSGSKALYLEDCCRQWGCAYVRFDYFGHGISEGQFEEATIGRWLKDVLWVLDSLTTGPQILVGSSMGGWLMLLATMQRMSRVKALVGIASAPDFLEEFHRLTPLQAAELQEKGVCYFPSQYGDPYPVTATLIAEGKAHRVLDKAIPINCPVRLLHGLEDQEVSWKKSLEIAEKLTSTDVRVTLIKKGAHSLSSESDLELLRATVAELLEGGA
jgi:pimeloyl-ACP methyl ester carboxylesterase